MPGVKLELAQRANALALEFIEPRTPQRPTPGSLDERITAALTDVNRPLPFAELRARCCVLTAILYKRLAALTAAGPPRQVRPGLSPRRSLTEHARQSRREHSHNRRRDSVAEAVAGIPSRYVCACSGGQGGPVFGPPRQRREASLTATSTTAPPPRRGCDLPIQKTNHQKMK
jgi:hypothetical protein